MINQSIIQSSFDVQHNEFLFDSVGLLFDIKWIRNLWNIAVEKSQHTQNK